MSQGDLDEGQVAPRAGDLYNPYAAPETTPDWRILFDPSEHDAAAEVLYRFHWRRERTIRVLARFLLMNFALAAIVGAIMVAATLAFGLDPESRTGFQAGGPWSEIFGVGIAGTVISSVGCLVCWGLRRLARWARVLAVIGLTGCLVVALLVGWMSIWSIGLIRGGWLFVFLVAPIFGCLHLLLSPTGSVVFSPAYRVIAERKRAEAARRRVLPPLDPGRGRGHPGGRLLEPGHLADRPLWVDVRRGPRPSDDSRSCCRPPNGSTRSQTLSRHPPRICRRSPLR